MIHKKIETDNAPEPGNYSQAKVVKMGDYDVIYTSGQTGNTADTDEVVKGGIGPQTKQALENLKGIVEAANGTIEDIVKMTIFIKDMNANKADFEEAYKSFFNDAYPARSMVEVSEIPLVSEDTIVEMEAVAYVNKSPLFP